MAFEPVGPLVEQGCELVGVGVGEGRLVAVPPPGIPGVQLGVGVEKDGEEEG